MPHKRTESEFSVEWIDEAAGHDTLVVFVHGFQGHQLDTWVHETGPLYRRTRGLPLPELLTANARFDTAAIRHEARLMSQATVEATARAFATYLSLRARRHPRCILIAHSLGGVVCRKVIVDALAGEAPTPFPEVLGLLMYGTPNIGAEIARPAKLASGSAGGIAPFAGFLDELNREWQARVINGGDPESPPKGRGYLLVKAVVGTLDTVVPAASASAHLLSREVVALNRGHVGLTKASSPGDDVYLVARSFVDSAMQHEASGSRRRRYAIEALRHAALIDFMDGDIAISENEAVTISAPQAGGLCDVTSVTTRRGCRLPERIRVLLKIEGVHVEQVVHYQAVVGEGALSRSDFDAIAREFSPNLVQRAIDAELKVTDTKRSVVLKESTCMPGQGFAVLEFDLNILGMAGALGDLELSLTRKRAVALKHGWYSYFTELHLLEGIQVSVTAPWPIRPKVRSPWIRAERKGPIALGAGTHQANVVIAGPVPKGFDVSFMFIDEEKAAASSASSPKSARG
jgi:pimeloyl-ACP methyl ester carboxylesterase